MQASHSSSDSRWPWIAGGVIALAAVAWFSARSTGHKRHVVPLAAVPVTAAVAKTSDMDIALTTIGTVTPTSTVTVTSRVAGLLTEVHYREGQIVKQNDLLAVIDPRPYQAAVMQARGQLARDQAILEDARLNFERYRTAFQQHAIPEQQMATQKATVQEDQGIVQLDEGTLAAAQVNLDYTRITSPITGRAGLRLVDAGNNIPANGQNGLVVITQLQPITVIFTLSQEDLAQVSAGARAGQPLQVQVLERGQPKPIAEGKLITWDNEIDPTTGTFRLRAEFSNEDNALWPGEFVNVRLVTGVDRGAVIVPSRSVQSGPHGSYLFVIKPDQTVEMRTVDVFEAAQGIAAIRKGLAPGERVVVDGQYRLDQGSKVTVLSPVAAPKS